MICSFVLKTNTEQLTTSESGKLFMFYCSHVTPRPRLNLLMASAAQWTLSWCPLSAGRSVGSHRMHTVVSFSYTVISWPAHSCLVGKLRWRMWSEVKRTQTINLNLCQFPTLRGCVFIERSCNPKGEDASGAGQLLSVVMILTVVRTHTTNKTFPRIAYHHGTMHIYFACGRNLSSISSCLNHGLGT